MESAGSWLSARSIRSREVIVSDALDIVPTIHQPRGRVKAGCVARLFPDVIILTDGTTIMKLAIAFVATLSFSLILSCGRTTDRNEPSTPLVRTLDLNDGETAEVTLSNGATATVKLLARHETIGSLRGAVRKAVVDLEVNGEPVSIECAGYNLPRTVAGVQVACTVTSRYMENARENAWHLEKDARLQLWPAGSPWIQPETFRYPVKQRWFASDTQMCNEPPFVDGGEYPSRRVIPYHYALDVGAAEKMAEVVSATSGRVVVRGDQVLPEYKDHPAIRVRYDVVIVVDERGWFHRYQHLASIDDGVMLGKQIALGQRLGVVGKEGDAGCWAHLHYAIRSRLPSGEWGILDGYAFLWEAYLREYSPEIIAVARPHFFVATGEPVRLDASRSWCRSGKIERYEWSFLDGTTGEGPVVERTYARPGTYSEILKVTDSAGHYSYDFAVVQVYDRAAAASGDEKLAPPTISAFYNPTFHLRAGEPVTFQVRTCRTTDGHETWNFADGSAPVAVTSDGCVDEHDPRGYAITEHVFRSPGDYLVRVDRTNRRGETATAHLWVKIEGQEQ